MDGHLGSSLLNYPASGDTENSHPLLRKAKSHCNDDEVNIPIVRDRLLAVGSDGSYSSIS